jgi:hypothetical protein
MCQSTSAVIQFQHLRLERMEARRKGCARRRMVAIWWLVGRPHQEGRRRVRCCWAMGWGRHQGIWECLMKLGQAPVGHQGGLCWHARSSHHHCWDVQQGYADAARSCNSRGNWDSWGGSTVHTCKFCLSQASWVPSLFLAVHPPIDCFSSSCISSQFVVALQSILLRLCPSMNQLMILAWQTN